MSLAPSLAESLSRNPSMLIKKILQEFVEAVVPHRIDRSIVESYYRKAARLGALHRLDPFERAFLHCLRTWLSRGYRLASRAIIDLTRRILALIELSSLRGRAIALGILMAMRRGFRDMLRDMLSSVEELLVIGLQIINTPTAYRII